MRCFSNVRFKLNVAHVRNVLAKRFVEQYLGRSPAEKNKIKVCTHKMSWGLLDSANNSLHKDTHWSSSLISTHSFFFFSWCSLFTNIQGSVAFSSLLLFYPVLSNSLWKIFVVLLVAWRRYFLIYLILLLINFYWNPVLSCLLNGGTFKYIISYCLLFWNH